MIVRTGPVSGTQSYEAQHRDAPLIGARPELRVVSQRTWQRARSPLTWVLVAIAALYLSTLFPGVGGRINGGDSAKFQFIGVIGGIGHPPGSPLYLMLNALWVRIPWPCSSALRVTLLSLALGLITLLVLGRALSRWFGARTAVCGVIALALGPSALRRNVQFAQLPGMSSDYYAFAPMKQLSWQDTQQTVVCTLRESDAKRLSKA